MNVLCSPGIWLVLLVLSSFKDSYAFAPTLLKEPRRSLPPFLKDPNNNQQQCRVVNDKDDYYSTKLQVLRFFQEAEEQEEEAPGGGGGGNVYNQNWISFLWDSSWLLTRRRRPPPPQQAAAAYNNNNSAQQHSKKMNAAFSFFLELFDFKKTKQLIIEKAKKAQAVTTAAATIVDTQGTVSLLYYDNPPDTIVFDNSMQQQQEDDSVGLTSGTRLVQAAAHKKVKTTMMAKHTDAVTATTTTTPIFTLSEFQPGVEPTTTVGAALAGALGGLFILGNWSWTLLMVVPMMALIAMTRSFLGDVTRAIGDLTWHLLQIAFTTNHQNNHKQEAIMQENYAKRQQESSNTMKVPETKLEAATTLLVPNKKNANLKKRSDRTNHHRALDNVTRMEEEAKLAEKARDEMDRLIAEENRIKEQQLELKRQEERRKEKQRLAEHVAQVKRERELLEQKERNEKERLAKFVKQQQQRVEDETNQEKTQQLKEEQQRLLEERRRRQKQQVADIFLHRQAKIHERVKRKLGLEEFEFPGKRQTEHNIPNQQQQQKKQQETHAILKPVKTQTAVDPHGNQNFLNNAFFAVAKTVQLDVPASQQQVQKDIESTSHEVQEQKRDEYFIVVSDNPPHIIIKAPDTSKPKWARKMQKAFKNAIKN